MMLAVILIYIFFPLFDPLHNTFQIIFHFVRIVTRKFMDNFLCVRINSLFMNRSENFTIEIIFKFFPRIASE